MNFVTKITATEKKAIYDRTIAEIEKRIISQIVQLGMDPDTFDETSFVPATDPVSGTVIRGQEVLKEELAALAIAKQKLSEI